MDGGGWGPAAPAVFKTVEGLNPLEGSTPFHSRQFNFNIRGKTASYFCILGEHMEIIDISMEIHPGMMVYKNRKGKRPQFESTRSIANGEGANETRICLDSHTGTHIDAVSHFMPYGKTTSQIPLDNFVGLCRVIDLTHLNEKITAEDLKEKNISKNQILLLKTKNSFNKSSEFDFNFVYLEKSGAEYLARMEVKTVGIDALGIERDQPDADTHKTLLGNGIPIIEGLQLSQVSEGGYMLFCLPMPLKDLDGAPVRAVLIKNMIPAR